MKGLDRPVFLLEVDPDSKEARELEVVARHRVTERDAYADGLGIGDEKRRGAAGSGGAATGGPYQGIHARKFSAEEFGILHRHHLDAGKFVRS